MSFTALSPAITSSFRNRIELIIQYKLTIDNKFLYYFLYQEDIISVIRIILPESMIKYCHVTS
jgi:hypothetical protein